MSRGTILVVGGGIGGLSAAIALSMAKYDVTVVERYADVHSSVYGVGIIQPSNALRALDAIDCAEACIAAGYPAKGWGKMYNAEGEFLHDMPGIAIEGMPPLNGLTRPKLHEILTNRALEVGVEIRYSTSFAVARARRRGRHRSAHRWQHERFDVVVGADGVRSKVRPYVLDEELQPRYIGQSAYRVNIPREPEIDRIILQGGSEGMAGFVPIGPDLAYMFYNAQMERAPRDDEANLAEQLREHLAGFGGLTGRVRDT